MDKDQVQEFLNIYEEFKEYRNNCHPFERQIITISITRMKDLLSPYLNIKIEKQKN